MPKKKNKTKQNPRTKIWPIDREQSDTQKNRHTDRQTIMPQNQK